MSLTIRHKYKNFTLLFRELKTAGKSFIFAVCRLTYDQVTSNLISLFKHVLGLDKQDLTKMSEFHKMSFFSGFPHSKCVFSRLCE